MISAERKAWILSDKVKTAMQPPVASDFKSGWWCLAVASVMIQSEGKNRRTAAETGRSASGTAPAAEKRVGRKESGYESIRKNTDAEKRKRMVTGRTGRKTGSIKTVGIQMGEWRFPKLKILHHNPRLRSIARKQLLDKYKEALSTSPLKMATVLF